MSRHDCHSERCATQCRRCDMNPNLCKAARWGGRLKTAKIRVASLARWRQSGRKNPERVGGANLGGWGGCDRWPGLGGGERRGVARCWQKKKKEGGETDCPAVGEVQLVALCCALAGCGWSVPGNVGAGWFRSASGLFEISASFDGCQTENSERFRFNQTTNTRTDHSETEGRIDWSRGQRTIDLAVGSVCFAAAGSRGQTPAMMTMTAATRSTTAAAAI
jgi:hypothetical protein